MDEIQKENLKKLAYYLLDYPGPFSLRGWNSCAIGIGNRLLKPESTNLFSPIRVMEELFGVSNHDVLYFYLFSSYWYFYDNTPRGTARRIIRYLSSGIPKGFILPDKKWVL